MCFSPCRVLIFKSVHLWIWGLGFGSCHQEFWCFASLPYLKQPRGLVEILKQYVPTGKLLEQKTDHLSVRVTFRLPGAVYWYPHFIIVVLVGCSGNPADLCFESVWFAISARTPAILAQVSRGFPPFLQTNTGAVHWLGHDCMVCSPLQYVMQSFTVRFVQHF